MRSKRRLRRGRSRLPRRGKGPLRPLPRGPAGAGLVQWTPEYAVYGCGCSTGDTPGMKNNTVY